MEVPIPAFDQSAASVDLIRIEGLVNTQVCVGLQDRGVCWIYTRSVDRQAMMKYQSMTVPALRTHCRTHGLPTYQYRGRRLRKADLIRFLTRGVPDAVKRPRTRPARQDDPNPSERIQTPLRIQEGYSIGARKTPAVMADGADVVADPMAVMRAKAERDLLIDFYTATKHATALGISRSELLDQDATTMHRILQGYARPTDERHWRTKEMIRAMVAVR